MSVTSAGHGSRDGDLQSDLLGWIDQKRPEVKAYLRLAGSRRRLLMNTTILAGTLAAALTAAPALGGKSFADWLTSVLSLSSPAWQLLCGVASLCAVAAAVATQLLKSHNVEERITCAQGARVKIEMLEVGIKSGLITPTDAAGDYIKCIGDIAFIQGPLKKSRAHRTVRPALGRSPAPPSSSTAASRSLGVPAPRRCPPRSPKTAAPLANSGPPPRSAAPVWPLWPASSTSVRRSGTGARWVERTLDPPRPPAPRPPQR